MHCYLAQAFVHGFLVVNPDLVLYYWKVDATRRGGLARFINHSCDVRPYSFFTLLSSLTWWKRCKFAGSNLAFIHAKPQDLCETVKGLQERIF
jgi:SET domain-containing protein